MASTAPPTDVVARTLRLLASRREIPAAPPSATQTDCAAATTDDGRVPNSISVSLFVAGSMGIKPLAAPLTRPPAFPPRASALRGARRAVLAGSLRPFGAHPGALLP